jgi:tetratricopeptide (TPR) repeat protein
MGDAVSTHERMNIFLALLALSSTAAADQVTDQARELLNGHQAGSAYALLAPLSDERAGDPDFDYLLGIAALDSGQPGQAVFALERVLAVKPDDALARAEIARAYYALSEFQTSKQEFENVKTSAEVPATARATMDEYLKLIDRAQRGEQRLSGYVGFSTGYDTNVNSGTDQSTIAIPVLGNLPFQLVDKATSQDDPFAAVSAGVDGLKPIDKTWAVIGGARGYYRATESPFSTADTYLYGGVRGSFGKHELIFAGQGEDFIVDADSLRFVYGGYAQWNYAIDNKSRLSLSFQGNKIDYPDLNHRNATRYVTSASYLLAIPGKREPVVYAGVYGGVEQEDQSSRPQFGHDLYGGRVGGSIELLPKLRGFTSFSMEQRDYHGPDPIFLRTRDDTQYIVSGGVEYKLCENWMLRPNVSYTINNSNIAINDYDRVVVGIDVTMQF